MRRILGCCCLLCVLFFRSGPVHAEWPADGTPLCSLDGTQRLPHSIPDGAGGAIVAWEDCRTDANGDIYAQRVDANGNALWMSGGVAVCTAADIQSHVRLASDGAGGAIITWTDNRSGNYDIYAQRLDAGGGRYWTPNGVVVCAATRNQTSPTLVAAGAGGAVIVWEDYRSGTSRDIYAQQLDGDGNPQWAPDGIGICTQANTQEYVDAVSDGSGGAAITWHDNRSGTSYEIYAQRVNAVGAVMWAANGVAVTSTAGNQLFPVLISDGASGAIIAWQDERNGAYRDLYAQRVNAGGGVVWTANGVAVCTAVGTQNEQRLLPDGAGGAIIAWQDTRSGAGADIYAQRFNSSGTMLWTPDGVPICWEGADQYAPKVASDGGGGAIITWEDSRPGETSDVYAQRIYSTGVLIWPTTGIALCSAPSFQDKPEIVADGLGGGIVVWQDERSGTSVDVYAGRVDGDGNAGWTRCGVPIAVAGSDQFNVQIVSDGGTGAIMAWEDRRNNPVESDIYAQRVFSDGFRLWSKNGLPVSTAPGNQMYPGAAPDGSGGLLVAWQDSRNSNYDVYAQRVGPIQNILWRQDGAAVCSTTAWTHYPQVVSDGADGAIVVWENVVTGVPSDIYAQRLNGSGALMWTPAGVAVCSATNHQMRPQVVSDNVGGAIVAWYDLRSGTADVYAQRLDAGGNPLWAPNGVTVCGAGGSQNAVRTIPDGAGGVIIVWVDTRAGDYDIYASRLDSSGVVLWAAGGVPVCAALGSQLNPSLVSSGVGGAIVVWEDTRGESSDVYAQRLDSSGAALWQENGILVSSAPGDQFQARTASDGAGGAIVAWQDGRSGTSSDVYAQRIGTNGRIKWGVDGFAACAGEDDDTWPVITQSSLGHAIIAWSSFNITMRNDIYAQSTGYTVVAVPEDPVFPAVSPPIARLEQNYPNPFNPATRIAFSLSEAADVRLCVYDIAGRLVRVLEDGRLDAGRHEAAWDGRDSAGGPVASGIYLCRLEWPGAKGRGQRVKMVMVR